MMIFAVLSLFWLNIEHQKTQKNIIPLLLNRLFQYIDSKSQLRVLVPLPKLLPIFSKWLISSSIGFPLSLTSLYYMQPIQS
jgi:hypothetical protein